MEIKVTRRPDNLWEMVVDGRLLLDGITGDAVTFTKSERLGFMYGQDNALTRVVWFLQEEFNEQRRSPQRHHHGSHEFGGGQSTRHFNCRPSHRG